jgi:acyl-coenzyme A synthetase/AMP-(fatty) acid ligase
VITAFLQEVFQAHAAADAIVWNDTAYSYQWLIDRVQHLSAWLSTEGVPDGAVTSIEAEFSPNAVALLLALLDRHAVLVPLTAAAGPQRRDFLDIAEVELSFRIAEDDNVTIMATGTSARHELYGLLGHRQHPGLVLFSSGSTGKSKAAVHDMDALLEKFRTRRRPWRTISFLRYDHIGGINTLLSTLGNAGCLVTVPSRDPDGVLQAIETWKVELLPASPTFINLMMLSGATTRHDLSSLQLVTYGTEPMPESTLKRFHELFPHIRLAQTYGLSELGILRAKSKGSGSLWVKVGGDGFDTRVVGGILQVKARSAMLGYLNAPSPFTDDGWFHTGDAVEVDGEYIRILGRVSEIINVGGEKVYPAEVESVVQELDTVAEVTVYGESNAITGRIVCAKVRLDHEEDAGAFRARLKSFCADRLQRYQVPVKIVLSTERQHSERFKKLRVEHSTGERPDAGV